MKNLSMMLAMDLNGGIGIDNKLPWHIPTELKYFKQVTTGKTVVMGRKTFDSIGKPLPNRKNIVLTSDTSFHIPEVTTIGCQTELEGFLNYFKYNVNEECIIIGGKLVYQQLAPYVEKIYLTVIIGKYPVDVTIDLSEMLNLYWDLDNNNPSWNMESKEVVAASGETPAFIKYVYTRINDGV